MRCKGGSASLNETKSKNHHLMKSTQRILGLTAALLISCPGLFAQTTGTTTGTATGTTVKPTTPPTTTTTTPPTTTIAAPITPPSPTTTLPPPIAVRPSLPTTPPPPTTTPPPPTTTTPPPAPAHGKASPHTLPANASDNAKAVQAVLAKFDASRDLFMAERKALIEKLNAAKTEAERKAILEQLRTENADQRALGKEIRDELKKVREKPKS